MPQDKKTRPKVAAVTRALTLLLAFRDGEDRLSLAELSGRTGLYKSTALRLLQTLEDHAFILRLPGDEGYRLGPANFRLGMLYQKTFKLEDVIVPALEELVALTGESVSFFVLDGETRMCLFRVDSKQSVRHTVEVGEPLPINRGATGKVFMQFSAGAHRTSQSKFQELPIMSVGKGVLDISVVSGPVFGFKGELIGAVSVSGPSSRLDDHSRGKVARVLIPWLARLTGRLGGDPRIFDTRRTAASQRGELRPIPNIPSSPRKKSEAAGKRSSVRQERHR